MSVIHDALKRARQSRSTPRPAAPAGAQPPAFGGGPKGGAPAWLWWLTLVLFLAESGLHFHTYQRRLKAEEKLQNALLQLNDERARTLELLSEKSVFDARLAQAGDERDQAILQRDAISKAKQDVEFENLEKEKKLYEMSKQIHELEMVKWQLTNELNPLKIKSEGPPAEASPKK